MTHINCYAHPGGHESGEWCAAQGKCVYETEPQTQRLQCFAHPAGHYPGEWCNAMNKCVYEAQYNQAPTATFHQENPYGAGNPLTQGNYGQQAAYNSGESPLPARHQPCAYHPQGHMSGEWCDAKRQHTPWI